ncbi:18 kDa seed maturation protein-like [Coffea eugenioides]|uniref:18 kDa seed maturation protein-like n=1 Tax=Coffea eugenioides TaxID=49369 RepID=UPI000F60F2C1|nr:18 kDa seed maturation protein-like [Coffea eugenioides]
MQAIKEKAANVAASAKSGMEKTKATMQEKVDRAAANNPTEKEMATERKEQKVNQAEFDKRAAQEHNAAARNATKNTGQPHTYSTTGAPGHPTGTHQQSALPGHGTGQPTGQVTEGVVESHHIGTATGTGRTNAAHNTHVGAATNIGGSYT